MNVDFALLLFEQLDKKNNNKPKIWIYRDKITGEGKGEATLTYDDPHTAKSAINWFNGKELPGTNKILNVEFAQRRNNFQGGRGGGFRGGPRNGRGGGGPPGAPGGPRDSFSRQGDWRLVKLSIFAWGSNFISCRCPVPTCGNNNFSWRNECNRCKAPRPEGEGGGSGGPGGMDRRGPPPDRRGGMGGPPMDRRGPPGGGPRGPPRGGFGDRGPPRGVGGDRGPRGRGGPPGGDFRGPPRGGGPMRGGAG